MHDILGLQNVAISNVLWQMIPKDKRRNTRDVDSAAMAVALLRFQPIDFLIIIVAVIFW